MKGFVSFSCGLIFAIGLGISGMTNPEKVLGFLTLSETWDPSLAFVMVGAIGVHLISYLWAKRSKKPLYAENFDLPANKKVDAKLLVGALLFGLGWGLGGFCPGPAITSLVTFVPKVLIFCVAMFCGFAIYNILDYTLSLRNKTR